MNILVLDDEKLAMNHLVYILEKISLENKIIGFCSPTEAIIAVESGQFQPQIAFLDIEMYGVNGLEVAKRLKESIPTIGIIFTTAYSDYAIDAFRIHARGYLLKPLTIERVREEIDEFRSSIYTIEEPDQDKIKVHCFGAFEVYFEGKPLRFSRTKTKELFAFLVHRQGAGSTVREIAAALYEDKYNISIKNQIQTLKVDLIKTFSDIGFPDTVINQRNSLSIRVEDLDCDYYKFMNMDITAVNSYQGSYMERYYWAEFSLGYFDEVLKSEYYC